MLSVVSAAWRRGLADAAETDVPIKMADVQDVAYSLPSVGVTRAASDRAFERGLTVLFGTAILVSAWLLFLVQPMFAKMVLPRLGGTPSVWNTCVVFFQATLLVGYLYSHLTTRWLGVRRQAILHLGVLCLPLFALPIALPADAPPTTGTPVWWLLGVLTRAVGLPFFVVSTTSPLLQRWFSAMPHRGAKDPYFLYSSSNCASLLALVSYPAIIEPMLRLADQSWMWTWAYALFVVLVGACAVLVRAWARPEPIAAASHEEIDTAAAASGHLSTRDIDGARVLPADRVVLIWRDRLGWLACSFVPSSLMLGVTTHISTDIAAVPLLWVVPLALYLATFMLVFARRPLLPARGLARLLPFLALATLVSVLVGSNAWWLILLHLVTFFVAAAVCHYRLAEARPSPRHLTEFYLWMSVGGVLGGLFNTLVAPLLFTGVIEYPLALAAACAIAYSHRLALLVMLAIPTTVFLVLLPPPSNRQMLFAARSFFGVHRVVDDAGFHRLLHGGTVHGVQRRDAMEVCERNAYYHSTGPLGQVFEAVGQRFQRVGVVGLGSGNAACFGRAGQTWTFFEIDPTVERIARDRRLFSYLAITPATVDVRLGDGRLLLAAAAPATFDCLILDAFSSDAIPLHLVTREAIALANSRLRPDGVLAFHISNRYLDLAPVLGAIARDAGLEARVNFDAVVSPVDPRAGKQASRWVIMTRGVAAMGSLARDARWQRVPSARTAWTDDFSNILSAFVTSPVAAAR